MPDNYLYSRVALCVKDKSSLDETKLPELTDTLGDEEKAKEVWPVVEGSWSFVWVCLCLCVEKRVDVGGVALVAVCVLGAGRPGGGEGRHHSCKQVWAAYRPSPCALSMIMQQ